MFDVLIVATTLCAWGFGLWCYPKCIQCVSTTCLNSNSAYDDQIIVDEATVTLNYPIYYTDEVMNFDEQIMNDICMNHSLNTTTITNDINANNIVTNNELKLFDENSNQKCTTQETIPVAKLISRGYIYCP